LYSVKLNVEGSGTVPSETLVKGADRVPRNLWPCSSESLLRCNSSLTDSANPKYESATQSPEGNSLDFDLANHDCTPS